MFVTTAYPSFAVPNEARIQDRNLLRRRSHFRGEMHVSTRLITQSEIDQRQLSIRQGAHAARNGFTLSGLRQLFGNTFIALGQLVHGRNEKCLETLSKKPTAMPVRGLQI